MSVLADTNILLRRVQPNHPRHAVAIEDVARLLAAIAAHAISSGCVFVTNHKVGRFSR